MDDVRFRQSLLVYGTAPRHRKVGCQDPSSEWDEVGFRPVSRDFASSYSRRASLMWADAEVQLQSLTPR